MMEPCVYIIVLNYCSALDTIECVQTIRDIEYANLRLLVIDNSSPDGSGAELRQVISNDQEFLQMERNTGYAGANNEGIQRALAAGADYIMIVNPDIRLSKHSVKSYVDVLSENKDAGALNPVQLDPEGKAVDPVFLKGIIETHRIKVSELFEGTNQEWGVGTLYGACLILRASTIEKVGGFDPLYFAYGEETDLCRRITFHGYKLLVTGRAPVRHLRTKAQEGFDSFRLFLCLKATYLYLLKNPKGSFRQGLMKTLRNLGLDILRRRNAQFPRYMKEIGPWHVVRVAVWIFVHVGQIWRHREIEKEGRAYV